MIDEIEHAALTRAEQGGDIANELVGRVNGDALHWFVELAIDLASNNLRLTNGELKAFAAHLFNQDGQLQFSTALNLPGVGTLSVDNLDGNVADEFLIEAVLHHAGRQQLAFGSG